MQPGGRSAPGLWQGTWVKEATTFEQLERGVRKVTEELSAEAEAETKTKAKASRGRPRARRRAVPAPGASGSPCQAMEERRLRNLYYTSRNRALQEIYGKAPPPCGISVEELQQYFERILSARDPGGPLPALEGSPRLPKIDSPEALEELRRDFTPEEVAERLKKVLTKPNGKDTVFHRLLKKRDPKCHVLAAIFNKCKEFGQVPSAWKKASAVLMYKSGEPSDPGNWRPLYLCSTLYKMYARCLAQRITSWAMAGGAVSPQQKAYVPSQEGRNEHHFLLQSVLDAVWHEPQEVAVAKLDLANAFGSLRHQHIFDTLLAFGMPEDFLNLIRELYDGCTTVVRAATGTTGEIPIQRGVKQGCPLSPIIFNLTIEPLIRYVARDPEGFSLHGKKISILAYADDLVLVASNEEGLQCMLDRASEAAGWLGLRFNTEKCEFLHIRQKHHCSSKFTIQGKTMMSLQRDQTFQYLGMPLFYSNQPVKTSSAFQKVMKEADAISESLLTPGQKMNALKTSFLPKISSLLTRLPVTKKDLENAEGTITEMVKKWLSRSKEPTALWIPKERGGHGVLPLKTVADVAAISHAFHLLNCSDDTVRDVARSALRTTVQKKLGPDASKEKLDRYLNGDFRCDGGDIANLWCRARNATQHSRRLVCWIQTPEGGFKLNVQGSKNLKHALEGVFRKFL